MAAGVWGQQGCWLFTGVGLATQPVTVMPLPVHTSEPLCGMRPELPLACRKHAPCEPCSPGVLRPLLWSRLSVKDL